MPAIVDPEGPDGEPISVFESGAILVYLAEKAGRYLPHSQRGRYEALQWLMFQMASVGPMLGQAHRFRARADPLRHRPLHQRGCPPLWGDGCSPL
jgi:GSH-dependent disulfide-bond oxidoreductase